MVSVSGGQYLVFSETGGVQNRKRRVLILILHIDSRFQFEAYSGGVYRQKHGERRAPLTRRSVLTNSNFLQLLRPHKSLLRLQLSLSQQPRPFIHQHHFLIHLRNFLVSIPISLLQCGFVNNRPIGRVIGLCITPSLE